MKALSSIIAPVLMKGQVNGISEEEIKINLIGRLGVIYISKKVVENGYNIKLGDTLEFFFSYIWVEKESFEYDSSQLLDMDKIEPCLASGVLEEVNDTAVKVKIHGNLGTVAVPRRWVFTEQELEEGQNVEFYLSRMKAE
ncbi:MAG: CBO2463/CBO2479 domain-containing protein [Peptacetobacter hiranonis]|nr:CBO2463/CBO2479 domain-containing protein [Peptacetobacter hiranonis]